MHTEVSVTREQASQARVLGEDPKSGRPVSVRMGRYGAFIQIGTKDDDDKPLFAGLRPDIPVVVAADCACASGEETVADGHQIFVSGSPGGPLSSTVGKDEFLQAVKGIVPCRIVLKLYEIVVGQTCDFDAERVHSTASGISEVVERVSCNAPGVADSSPGIVQFSEIRVKEKIEKKE